MESVHRSHSDGSEYHRTSMLVGGVLMTVLCVLLTANPVVAARAGHRPHTDSIETAVSAAPDDEIAPPDDDAGDDSGCDRLDSYTRAVALALLDGGMTTDDLEFFEDFDIETATPSELRRGSRIAEEMHDALAGMDETDIPPAARDYHDALIDLFGLMSQVLTAVANGGVWAALPYTDALDESTARLEQATEDGRALCGAAWDDAMG